MASDAVVNRLLAQISVLERENMKRHQQHNVLAERVAKLEAALANGRASPELVEGEAEEDPSWKGPPLRLKRGFASKFAVQAGEELLTDYLPVEDAKAALNRIREGGHPSTGSGQAS